MEIITKNANETKKLGEKLGSLLKKQSRKRAKVLALVGELGAGKTTFIQGFAKGLGIRAKVTSPTFVLIKEYQKGRQLCFHHIDLYRLENISRNDIKNLGIEETWQESKNITVIEWAEKVKRFLPRRTIWIYFKKSGEGLRKIDFDIELA